MNLIQSVKPNGRTEGVKKLFNRNLKKKSRPCWLNPLKVTQKVIFLFLKMIISPVAALHVSS